MTCDISDLPIDQCGCDQHHRGEVTVISIRALERIAGRPLPQYRCSRRNPEWAVPEPKVTVCTHRVDDLCGPCSTILDTLLQDLPALVEHLGYAMAKDARFPVRGHRRGDVEHPDESPIPWNPSAAFALGELQHIIATGRDLDRHALLKALSTAARRAHRIIDRPTDRIFTMCPRCRADIWLARRDTVQCPGPTLPDGTRGECSYAASWSQHQGDLLDANGDAMLTMDDLCTVLTNAGEPMTRHRVNKMITRHGLPREQIVNPHWDGPILVTEPRWVYRLKDVRDLQSQIDTRKAS